MPNMSGCLATATATVIDSIRKKEGIKKIEIPYIYIFA